MSLAPLGGALWKLDCTHWTLKYLVTPPFELSTLRPYPGVRSLSFTFDIRYGFPALPSPETTPFAAVKSLSALIVIGAWSTGAQVTAKALDPAGSTSNTATASIV